MVLNMQIQGPVLFKALQAQDMYLAGASPHGTNDTAGAAGADDKDRNDHSFQEITEIIQVYAVLQHFAQDMYLAGAIVMVQAVLVVIGILFSDIALAFLDPRIR